jgi:abortive infection bacteriophage resistance protein
MYNKTNQALLIPFTIIIYNCNYIYYYYFMLHYRTIVKIYTTNSSSHEPVLHYCNVFYNICEHCMETFRYPHIFLYTLFYNQVRSTHVGLMTSCV